jgi:hypothetical protein
MNYKEQIPYNTPTKYVSLQETQNYECDQPCLCRFTDERSDKDRMYYDWFVLNKPIVIPEPSGKNNIPPIVNIKK